VGEGWFIFEKAIIHIILENGNKPKLKLTGKENNI